MERRHFLTGFTLAAAGVALGGPGLLAEPAAPGPSPFGPLRPADANGIRLPAGFTSRIVAQGGKVVPGTGYRWHPLADGGACFPRAGGGWTYVSNSEVRGTPAKGGASQLHFDPQGRIVGANRILRDTVANCAGGATPWNTWLSCEERTEGKVWECTTAGPSQGVARPALGVFSHEAVAVDPDDGKLYLTEDAGGTGDEFYRFTPTHPLPDLSVGVLESLVWNEMTGAVTWVVVDAAVPASTRRANGGPQGTAFDGNEGVWYHDGHVFFTAKVANRIYDLDVAAQTLSILWDANDHASPKLTGVDNLTMDRGDNLYCSEDGGNMEICLITPDGDVAPFLRVIGQTGSELTGPAFTPGGKRLYFSSQRGGTAGIGITYEVRGPFPTA